MSPYTTPTLPIVSAQNVVRPFAFAGVAPRRAAATVVMGDVIFAANAAPQYSTAARVYNRAVGALRSRVLLGTQSSTTGAMASTSPPSKSRNFFSGLRLPGAAATHPPPLAAAPPPRARG